MIGPLTRETQSYVFRKVYALNFLLSFQLSYMKHVKEIVEDK